MNLSNSKNKQNGFSLIELLLYMSLSTVMVAVLGGIGVHVLESRSEAHAQGEVLYNTQFITETLRTSLDSAKSITSPVPRATSSRLVLSMQDVERDPTIFDIEEGVVTMQIGNGGVVPLSGSSVTVPMLEFVNVGGGQGPGAIRLILQVESQNPEERTAFSAEATLRTTMSLKYTP